MSRAVSAHTINLDAARGMSLMALGMLIVPVIDAIAKLLGAEMSPLQVAWGRFFFQALLLTLLGFSIFGDFPQPITWLGVAIIVASGLFVYWRERRLRH